MEDHVQVSRKLRVAFVRPDASIQERVDARRRSNAACGPEWEIEVRTPSSLVDRYFRSPSWTPGQGTTGPW